jgi:hypothetical protein
MKRTLAIGAVVCLCLTAWLTVASAQERPVSAAGDTLKTTGEAVAPAPAAPAKAAPDSMSAGARARRARMANKRQMSYIISLGLGSAINSKPDSFKNGFNPSLGLLLSAGVRNWGLTLTGTFDYNFFLSSGAVSITPDDLNVLMLFADVKFVPLTTAAHPYFLVCGGLYRTWVVNTHYTEQVLGYGGGAGVEFEIDKTRRLWAEGRYVQGRTRARTELQANTVVIPFRLGISWEFKETSAGRDRGKQRGGESLRRPALQHLDRPIGYPLIPAARTSAGTACANWAKFWSNRDTSSRALRSYMDLSAHVLRGFSTSAGTPGHSIGMSSPNTESFAYFTLSSLPSSAAFTIAREYEILMRDPTPNPPPLQPVLTSQQCASYWRIFFARRSAYIVGGSTRKGAPKHVEKVACGSLPMPRSVPATLAV